MGSRFSRSESRSDRVKIDLENQIVQSEAAGQGTIPRLFIGNRATAFWHANFVAVTNIGLGIAAASENFFDLYLSRNEPQDVNKGIFHLVSPILGMIVGGGTILYSIYKAKKATAKVKKCDKEQATEIEEQRDNIFTGLAFLNWCSLIMFMYRGLSLLKEMF